MNERLSSGHPRLDTALGGGLPANGINMLIGLPGTGKTILAQQYVFTNATPERPGLYLATVSEPFDKILRYGQRLGFFDRHAIGRSVFYEDLGTVLNEGGVAGVLEQVSTLIKQRRPGIIVIDSFKALSAYAAGAAFRSFLHDLARHLSVFPASSLWVGEYGENEIAAAPEFAVADAIIALSMTRAAERETRSLRILKLRGSDFAPGSHAYRITENGFPRLADPTDITGYALEAARQSSGVAALDAMLADGYWQGASTLCAGPSGSGKTLMGLHFVFNGVRQGEPGVLATLQEHPTQLARVVKGFGWSLDQAGVELMYRSPVNVYIDEWVYDLLATVERTGARRVLIDSLTDLQFASPDEVRFREYMYSLVQRFSRQGVGLFMTSELPDLFQITRLSQFGVSHLSDNVVLLQYIREESTVRRTLTVLKTRASRHEPEIREFRIAPEGITLGEPLVAAPAFD
jgi:circadian clock protein KaiC